MVLCKNGYSGVVRGFLPMQNSSRFFCGIPSIDKSSQSYVRKQLNNPFTDNCVKLHTRTFHSQR